MNNKFLLFLFLIFLYACSDRNASIKESVESFVTYPFSDPDPIPNPDRDYYPYFRYGGFTLDPVDQDWKVVTLENDYIKVFIFPEVGGKIWGAIEKSTGREFIYYNSVVKFRDIAMRGPWTSGGIEFNFGTIGHAPTTSNTVDYIIKENDDGSVSCIVGSNELLTRMRWEVEIRLPKDKAWFSTTTTFQNTTSFLQPYYQWHNGAFQAEGGLEYCFPGDVRLGHGGEARGWPTDNEGRNLSWYKNNAFGGAKSDMIMGSTKGFYAAYWHDYNFGSGHYAHYGDKPGRKIFSWAQSRSGGIWEDLLTDTDGQYVEMQSGKSLNQAGTSSMWTPFKHSGFEPWQTDIFTEYWFPVLSTGGVTQANAFGALNVTRDGSDLEISFCPLEKTDDEIKIFFGNNLHESYKVTLDPLETWKTKLSVNSSSEPLKIILGDKKLEYCEKPEDLNRPVRIPEEFDWNSLYGLYTEGLNRVYQNNQDRAIAKFQACLQLDSFYAPALNQLAELYYRQRNLEDGLGLAKLSLSLDTYDPKANFVYGLINRDLGNLNDAEDGFSLAMLSPYSRISAGIELAKLYMLKGDLLKASKQIQKVIEINPINPEAIQVLAVISRKAGDVDGADRYLDKLADITPLNHFVRFEKMLMNETNESEENFVSMIKNELPNETFMEMTGWYESVGYFDEAIKLLGTAPGNTLIFFKLAYLYNLTSQMQKSDEYLKKAAASSPDFVFPFRRESIPVLEWAVAHSDTWHAKYLLGVLHWSLGNKDEARTMFTQCGNTPGRFWFYAAKPGLFGDEESYDPEDDLLKARSLKPDEWRPSKMLIDYYLDKKDTKQALDIANKALEDFPSNYEVRYAVAKCLLANGQFSECLEVLEGSNILPNEGASRGRVIYRQATLMKAIEFYRQKDFESARQFVDQARLWPENLGVGRPYEPDERIEDFLEAECLSQVADRKARSQELYQKVISYSENSARGLSSVDYVYLLTLRLMGKESQINEYLNRWRESSPEDPVLRWCEYMLRNNISAARQVDKLVDTGIEGGTPWNPKRTDPVFELIKTLGYVL